MKNIRLTAALMGASAFLALGAAQAQAQEPAPADAGVAADAPAPDEATANNEFLQAQVESLQAQIDSLKKQMTAAQPTWKGAPQWTDPDSGFTFKPKGVIQFDAGYVSLPGTSDKFGGSNIGGVNTNNLGFNSRARRLIFGAEGAIPGGFGYKLEFELSQSTVGYEDLVITYQKPGSPLLFTVGHHYPLSSLELLTSNRFTSFMERASNTDAFGYGRRLGASVAYLDPAGQYSLTAGIWGQDIASTAFNRTGWQASVRGVYSPMIGSLQGHIGFQAQHRVQPRDAQNVQYRARPFTQTTDQRFIGTQTIAADGDDILGVELAGIYKSFHFAGEAQKLWVRGYNAAKTFTNVNNSVAGGTILPDDPSFFSWYAEVGYFLTGETRGYKGGKWDRTKVLHPVDKGGWGAFQINARVDQTDLSDKVGSGPVALSGAGINYVNGGKQTGYQASLIWLPTDYVKFLLQYTRAHIEGGSPAAAVAANATSGQFVSSTTPAAQDRSFNVDQFGLRAQLDF